MAFQAIVVNGLAGLSSATTRDSCRHRLLEEFEALPLQLRRQRGQPGHVAAWLREARHEAGRHRVPSDRGDDRDGLGRVLGREGAGGAGREDDVRLETDKLVREDRMTFLLALRPLVPDDEILSLHVAELTEALTKGVDQVGFEGGRRVAQIPNRHGASGLLRLGGQRRREQAKGAQDEADNGSGAHGSLHIVLPAGLLAHVLCCGWQSGTACLRKPNARPELRGMAGATQERTLFPVSSRPWFGLPRAPFIG